MHTSKVLNTWLQLFNRVGPKNNLVVTSYDKSSTTTKFNNTEAVKPNIKLPNLNKSSTEQDEHKEDSKKQSDVPADGNRTMKLQLKISRWSIA